jgi:hypothetical protein
MQEKALPDDNKDLTLLRTVVRWFAVGGVSVLMAGSFLFMGYEAIWGKPSPKNWILALVEKHFAALLGTPAAAATAFFVVTLPRVIGNPRFFQEVSI